LEQDFEDIFCTPILDKYLLYAPRQHFSALVNAAAIRAIDAVFCQGKAVPGDLADIIEILRTDGKSLPVPKSDPAIEPFFLGLIPTRNCNLGCQYCDFVSPGVEHSQMSVALARSAVDAYIGLLLGAKKTNLELHFFGGEPFFAWDVVFFAVEYARHQAAAAGLETHFEVITNGVFSAERCRWIADHFDMVVLSLDGPAEVHERQRPSRNGSPTYATILRNAHILANGSTRFALRTCITQENVTQMAEFAAWAARELKPSSICFEAVVESPLSRQAGLLQAHPLIFVKNFLEAKKTLEPYGIALILSTDQPGDCQFSFCPVGKDALIVSPDGSVDACYWLETAWQQNGLDLHLGALHSDGFEFVPGAIQRVRQTAMLNKEACQGCLCQYRCAGGCHARRPSERQYHEICYQTRLLTVARLLHEMGQDERLDAWLQDRQAVETMVYRQSDRLVDVARTL
jgi:uncharacterized protein